MKVHRAIIHPQTAADLVVHLPERFLQTEIEIIAIAVDDQPSDTEKLTYEEVVKFYRNHSIDFSKIEKWKREDLYG